MSFNNKVFIKDKVLVSISCLAYNHEKYIRQCLDGFLTQKTNFAFEILVHDDASQDNTADIIREYEHKYPEIINPIYQTENQYSKGVSVSRTFNFPRAKGKYIAMCEGDDYWTDPLKLQMQVDFLEANKDFSLCFHNANIIDYKNNIIRVFNKRVINSITDVKNLISEEWYIPTASIVFRAKNFEPPSWYFTVKNGDYALQLLLTANGEKIKYIDKIMSTYRVHDAGASRMFLDKLVSLELMITLLRNFNTYTQNKYKLFIDKRITALYLDFLKSTKKYSKNYFKIVFRYLRHNNKMDKTDWNYLVGHILLPDFFRKKANFLKK